MHIGAPPVAFKSFCNLLLSIPEVFRRTTIHREHSSMNSKRHFAAPSLKPAALAVAATLLSLHAAAQTAPAAPTATAPVKAEKIEVTGSSIKRIEGESALPVQIITREDIDKSGSTTAAELLTKISASAAALTDGAHFSDIAGQRGFNGANLRGIGVASTLVLLNGRRMANFASPGGASGVDLNAIPAAAIDRVEVLKDGASAVYGTDAISGVINFITRREYNGADVSFYASATKDGGAGKKIATISGGFGNINKDRFNIFGVLDIQENDALRSTQRKGIGRSFDPSINLDVASSNTYPANFRRLTASGGATGSRFNPSAPTCNPPATLFSPLSFVGTRACYYDYMQDTEIFPASNRKNILVRGQYAWSDDHTLFAELTHSTTDTNYRISPLTVTNLNYPANGRYYPTATATAAGTTGALRLNWRLTEAGGRTNDVEAISERALIGAKGVFAGWDYDAAFNYSTSEVNDRYVDGYVLNTAFNNAVATGNINPFGPSDAAGIALLNSTKVSDNARASRGTTKSLDIKGSRPLFSMAGGDAALAIGLESRRENMGFTPSALLAAGEIRSEGTATAFSGSRTVNAAFAEVVLPFTKSLEVQLALRHDRYNDVGSTTNPKIGLRWTPLKSTLFRASYGTGFRAPSLADLYSPTRIGQTNGIYNDPLGCIRVGTIDNTRNPDYCGLQPDKLRGGTKSLKPEESKQYSLGFVFEPMRAISTSLDYWKIEKTQTIASPEGVYFSDAVFYAPFITRAAADPALPGIPGRITQIDSRLRNLGTLKTSGVDVGVDLRLPATAYGKFGVSINGTYVKEYKVQDGPGRPFVDGVGRFANDQVVQRWRHTATFNYDLGAFGATLQQTFYQGYRDQNLNADGSIRNVAAYKLWDLALSYSGVKNLRLRAGVKNLLDTKPPVSNQIYSFIAGYDPNYADPRGRAFYGSLAYSFK
jgi:iron complex outermembrane recepter protein